MPLDVGKTVLAFRFTHNKYEPFQRLTLAIETHALTVPVHGELVRVQLVDTAGQVCSTRFFPPPCLCFNSPHRPQPCMYMHVQFIFIPSCITLLTNPLHPLSHKQHAFFLSTINHHPTGKTPRRWQ